jgi:hypothetical protein
VLKDSPGAGDPFVESIVAEERIVRIGHEAFSERRAVDPSTGLSTFAYAKFWGREFALFIQDNWKVRPHVALTLGLRYEVFLSPRKVADTFTGILLGPGATRQEQVQNARIGMVDRLFDTDWNNLGPRVGVAWDVGGNGHTVARAGGGIAYNRINLTVWDDRLNPPRFANAFADARDPIPIVYTLGPEFQENPALGRGLDERGGIRGARVDLQVIDPQATVPYSYSWFAGVQRQLPWQLSFEANYIGTASRAATATSTSTASMGIGCICPPLERGCRASRVSSGWQADWCRQISHDHRPVNSARCPAMPTTGQGISVRTCQCSRT